MKRDFKAEFVFLISRHTQILLESLGNSFLNQKENKNLLCVRRMLINGKNDSGPRI